MVSAFWVSTAFLISYLIYHYRVGMLFYGTGLIRPVYFTILISHTILAVVIVPMILVTLRRACWSDSINISSSLGDIATVLYVSVTV